MRKVKNSVRVVDQQKTNIVKGTIRDDFGPIVGASVVIKGTTKGVVTDLDGNFTLSVPYGMTLVISYIGFTEQEIVYKGQTHLNITLEEEVQTLDEVQVIAYGTTKKVTVTGSMSSINSTDLLKTPASSMANALTGKVTGLSSVQRTGQPGADDPSIYVRGVGSLNPSQSTPLMLVDGVERSFFQLDPNEVEDITILKDASATAVFGVRGANGVIIVTTKRGKEGPARINFSTSAAVQQPTRMPNFANSFDYASQYNQAQLLDGVDPEALAFSEEALDAFRTHSNPIAYPDIDWADMIVKNSALQTQHNLTVSGGTKDIKYFTSLGVFTQDGLFKSFEEDYNSNFRYNRYNYRVNLDIDVTKTTSMKINLGGRVNNKRSPNYEGGSNIKFLFRDIYWATPFSGAGIVDGKWIVPDSKKIGTLPAETRDALYPYYGRGYNTNEGNTLSFDFVLEQKLDCFTKGLKTHFKGAYNSGVNLIKFRGGLLPSYEAILQENGSIILKKSGDKVKLGYKEDFGKSRNWYTEAALNYKRSFGKHSVTGLVMYNQSMRYYQGGGFNSIPRSYIGLVSRATYNFNTRYMVDFNIGYNGSENFAKGKRFGMFPAVSGGWIISEEKFMQSLKPIMNYLKLRASYGVVGSDRSADGTRFLYLPDVYHSNWGGYNFGTNVSTFIPGAVEGKKGNPNVTWETAVKQNYGADFYLFDSKLKLNLDYFVEKRKDILTSRQIDPGYLAVNLPVANIGKVNNKGYELNVQWKDRIEKVGYYISMNLSYAKNKIIFMDEIDYPHEYMKKTGKPVGQMFGYKNNGFFSEEDVAVYQEEKGKTIPDHGAGFMPKPGDVKYKDLNRDGKIDTYDRAPIGRPIYPLMSGGLNLGFNYKGFDLSMTFAGAAQTSRMLTDIFREPFGATNARSLMNYMIDDAWTSEKGNLSKAPTISFSSKQNNYADSDLWVKDASYIRLKNIELGYNFPAKILKPAKAKNLRLYVSGYNLFTFDKLKIVDPESNPTDNSMYPVVRVINAGLRVEF
ncbi:MAG: TonB-dependent receptor [Eubacteriales bacterium]|nr:TonB-dependent receptor [Eubacteriales bacterium]